MSVNRLFNVLESLKDVAQWRSAFGEPQTAGDRTIIPVARVGYMFGTGFGSGGAEESPAESAQERPGMAGEGGGGGGSASATPLGVIVVTPDDIYFEETVDAARVSLAGIAVGALFLMQVGKTLRAIFGK